MKNNGEKNESQIIRKDGKGCFVEVKNDCFTLGKVHLQFIKYDLNRPSGDRYTDNINIYIDVAEFLVLGHEAVSGVLYAKAKQFEAESNKSPLFQSMGGTSAKRLKFLNQTRADGKSLSRVFTVSQSNKGYFFSASSGPGEEDAKGLIVPKFGSNPENRVSVPISHTDVNEIMFITKAHYEAWLAAYYAREWPPETKAGHNLPPVQKSAEVQGVQQNGKADGKVIGKVDANDMQMF